MYMSFSKVVQDKLLPWLTYKSRSEIPFFHKKDEIIKLLEKLLPRLFTYYNALSLDCSKEMLYDVTLSLSSILRGIAPIHQSRTCLWKKEELLLVETLKQKGFELDLSGKLIISTK